MQNNLFFLSYDNKIILYYNLYLLTFEFSESL